MVFSGHLQFFNRSFTLNLGLKYYSFIEMNDDAHEKLGMPIYLHKEAHPLCDPSDKKNPDIEWRPGNLATKHLFRCIECMRDIDDLLVEGSSIRNEKKVRRKLKQILIPLLSFVLAIRDMIRFIESDKDSVNRLKEGDFKLLKEIKIRYEESIPLSSGFLLKKVRNKLAAHIDLDICPSEARDLLSQLSSNQVGYWIHVSLTVLSDLLKLNIYGWMLPSGKTRFARVMLNEPFLATFLLEGNTVVAMAGMEIVNESPKKFVTDLILDSIRHSQWMFSPTDRRLNHLVEDLPGEPWAKSLNTLSKLRNGE